MSLEKIHLNKLLKLMFLAPKNLTSELRKDIGQERRKQSGRQNDGGDFYAPFWSDAKKHALGKADIFDLTKARIDANRTRKVLYEKLRDGFLLWWNERRRWTNEPFQIGRYINARIEIPEVGVTVKVEGLLSVRDANNVEHFVYPYFDPNLLLDEKSAKLGLRILIDALPKIEETELRILDVTRGQTFSVDRFPLSGDESALIQRHITRILAARAVLREEYPD